jgi:hypothetical protein
MSDAPGFREFLYNPDQHKTMRDSCGDYALTFAEAKSSGAKATPQALIKIYDDMVAAGSHDYAHNRGGTTLKGLYLEAKRHGYTGDLYQSKTADQYHQILKDNAGKRPMVLFFTLAEKLVDAETGIGYSYRKPHEWTGPHLHGHFIMVDHAQEDGYVCADGANPQAEKRYAVYRWDTLVSAELGGILALDMKTDVLTTEVHPMTDYGNQLGGGFKALATSQKKTADLLIPETYVNEHESICLFADGTMYHYDSRTGKSDSDTTVAVKALFAAWQAAKSVPPTVPAALTGALADAMNVLAPFVNAYNELKAVS